MIAVEWYYGTPKNVGPLNYSPIIWFQYTLFIKYSENLENNI